MRCVLKYSSVSNAYFSLCDDRSACHTAPSQQDGVDILRLRKLPEVDHVRHSHLQVDISATHPIVILGSFEALPQEQLKYLAVGAYGLQNRLNRRITFQDRYTVRLHIDWKIQPWKQVVALRRTDTTFEGIIQNGVSLEASTATCRVIWEGQTMEVNYVLVFPAQSHAPQDQVPILGLHVVPSVAGQEEFRNRCIRLGNGVTRAELRAARIAL